MLENAMSFQAIGNGTVINFKKMSDINAYGRFKFTTFLNPPSRGRLKSIFEPQFHTLLSLSELALQKEKSPKRVSVRVSIEGQKAKKHPTTAECFFLFVESEGFFSATFHSARCKLLTPNSIK